MAPPSSALLPEKVLLVTFSGPWLSMAPPKPVEEEVLPENMLLVTFSVPPLVMAPAGQLAMVRFWTANVTQEFTKNTLASTQHWVCASVVVVVVAPVVLVVAPGRQGFGEQLPGPASIPPAALHFAARAVGISTQVVPLPLMVMTPPPSMV